MSDVYAYLEDGWMAEGALRSDLEASIDAVAAGWVKAGTPLESVEMLSELLARVADESEEDLRWGYLELSAWLPQFEVSKHLMKFLKIALGEAVDRVALAGLALHLLDIVEAMALTVYGSELPALMLHSDRSATDARATGLARHLKG